MASALRSAFAAMAMLAGLEIAVARDIVVIEAGQTVHVDFVSPNCTLSPNHLEITVLSSDKRVVSCDTCFYNATCGNRSLVPLDGIAIGLATVDVFDELGSLIETINVAVTRPPLTAFATACNYTVVGFLILTFALFGATLDLDAVKRHLKKPKSLLIGLASQFTLMPLIAFAVQFLIDMPPAVKLAVFASGCVPSGGNSNLFTKLLGGDVELSVALTVCTNVLSFGMTPLWLYTLGKVITDGTSIVIPYLALLQALASNLVPIAIGILIRRFLPKVGAVMVRALTPASVLTVIVLLSLGVASNYATFEFLAREPRIWLATLVPFIGLLAGGLFATAACETRPSAIAIAIETSIQNLTVAAIMLLLSLEPPWSNMAVCIAIAIGALTPAPLIVACTALLIARRMRRMRRSTLVQGTEEGAHLSRDGIAPNGEQTSVQ